MESLLKFTTVTTLGKRVLVDVYLTETREITFDIQNRDQLTPQEYFAVSQEIREKANAAIQSKLLLG